MAKMKEIAFIALQNTSAQFNWNDGWILCNKINEIIPVINVLIKEREELKEPCSMCSAFKKSRKWLVSKGNGMYEEYTYQYCPICGRKLGDEG